MGCFSPEPPPTPDYGQINRDTLQAQVDIAPDKLKAEQATRPGYTALDLQELRHSLLGDDQNRGILSLLEEDVLPSYQRAGSEAQRIQREQDLADLRDLSPEYLAALKSANPEQAALVTRLTKDAQDGLDKPGLSPYESRSFQQNFRSASRGRLGNTGTAGASAESFYLADRERQRLDANRAFAQSMVGMNQAVYGDPFMQITGRASGAVPAGIGVLGTGQGMASGAGPKLFNERDPLAHDLAMTGYNAQVASDINGANAWAGIISGGIGAIGGIGGGFASRGRN